MFTSKFSFRTISHAIKSAPSGELAASAFKQLNQKIDGTGRWRRILDRGRCTRYCFTRPWAGKVAGRPPACSASSYMAGGCTRGCAPATRLSAQGNACSQCSARAPFGCESTQQSTQLPPTVEKNSLVESFRTEESHSYLEAELMWCAKRRRDVECARARSFAFGFEQEIGWFAYNATPSFTSKPPPSPAVPRNRRPKTRCAHAHVFLCLPPRAAYSCFATRSSRCVVRPAACK